MKEHACTLSITRSDWPDIAAWRATCLLASLNGNRAARAGWRQRKLRALRRHRARAHCRLWHLQQSDTQVRRPPAGSLLYMSPEQILNQPLSCRSDVYQLGLILFVCLFGRLPFEPDPETAVAYRFRGAIFPDWAAFRVRELGAELAAILTAMLARDPAQRMASMGTLARRLLELPGAQLPG